MAGKMCKEQRIHLLRYLIGSIVTNARKCGKLVWRGDELTCPLGCRPPDRVVGVALDEQGWHLGRADGLVADTSRPIPRKRRFHSLWVPDDGQVRLDRGRRHTILD
jgi:hypothetical protein